MDDVFALGTRHNKKSETADGTRSQKRKPPKLVGSLFMLLALRMKIEVDDVKEKPVFFILTAPDEHYKIMQCEYWAIGQKRQFWF